MPGGAPEPADYGEVFATFVRTIAAQAEQREQRLGSRIAEHLQTDPSSLPVVSQDFASYEQPNLQMALEAILAKPGTRHEVIGISGEARRYMGVAISDLIGRGLAGPPIREGPVEYINFELADGRILACLDQALLLVETEDERYALLISGAQGAPVGRGLPLRLQVVGRDRDRAQALVAAIRRSARELNVYRGHVISFSPGVNTPSGAQVLVEFHHLPETRAEDIVLPPGILERIERHTVGFSRHADALLAAGRSLKRGMLLYGLPGTGKTLTAMYLCSQMKGRTTILTTGRGLGMVGTVSQLARELEPSLVVIEDVDLIAEERGQPHPFMRSGPLLFELLNELDGLRDDADVIFVLTTNRADILEPALAARPGRIDLAIELPLPDADARRRLLELYSRGLTLDGVDEDVVVAGTEGAAPAYLKELLRKAAVLALERGGGLNVTQVDLESAMTE
ncbi:MAG: 26S protease regulatory subunit, partial [Candidatus Dormibacteraeota bacterium]|nr:26S protease regulatory subunit [Candidatus Dormibacteraeota bacterium]